MKNCNPDIRLNYLQSSVTNTHSNPPYQVFVTWATTEDKHMDACDPLIRKDKLSLDSSEILEWLSNFILHSIKGILTYSRQYKS